MSDQHNPALVSEPEQPRERTYLVTGQAQETLGHRYGETFTALLPVEQEAALLAGGALTVVEAGKPTRAAGRGPELPVDPAPGHDTDDQPESSGPDDERRHTRKPVPHDRRRKATTTDTTTPKEQ